MLIINLLLRGGRGDVTPLFDYLYLMFVRRKKNRSGITGVVVVDKHGGKFKKLHIVGAASDEQ